MSGRDREAELLEEFSHLVETDGLIGQGGAFMNRLAALVEEVLDGGGPQVPEDPFRGKDRELALGSDLYYVMFWRLFDRTPAAMMQDFAIKLRRILAKRVFKRCGEDVVIHHNVLFSSGRNIELGDGVFVNRYVMLDDRAPITVGDYTTLAAGVIVETHGHIFDDFSKPLIYGGRTRSPVTIGSNSLIGYNAVVMAGVAVGDRCIVASNAVVTRDVPDRTVVGGVPARKIKEIVPRPPDADRGELF